MVASPVSVALVFMPLAWAPAVEDGVWGVRKRATACCSLSVAHAATEPWAWQVERLVL